MARRISCDEPSLVLTSSPKNKLSIVVIKMKHVRLPQENMLIFRTFQIVGNFLAELAVSINKLGMLLLSILVKKSLWRLSIL